MTFSLVKLHEVLLTDEYEIHIDEYARGQDQFLLLHLRFLKWTPSVFKRFSAHWCALRKCVTAPLYAYGKEQDDKWERFVTRFGFEPLCTITLVNGETRRLFTHRLRTEASHVRI